MKMKKQFFCIVLALVLLCVGVPLTAYAEDDTSDYTPVYTKEDLDNIRLNMSGKYILMNDIIFTDDDFKKGGDFYNSGKGWEPIGTQTNQFTGILDGNGKGIYYLVIHDDNLSNIGLFGMVSGCTIKNCTLSVDILGKNNIGALIGNIVNSAVRIDNCRVKGTIKGSECVGGMIGNAEGTTLMTHCYVDCQIEGVKSVGGIIGYYQCHGSAGRIQNSLTEGTVTGNLSAGGLIGDFYINSTEEAPVVVMLQNNENRAAISGEGDVGGLIGYVNSSYHHYTYTRIEYSQTYYGQTYGVTVHVYPRRTPDIVNCMNIGIVSGLSENSNIGGIVGRFGGTTYNNENAIIEKCYNVGVVEGSGKKGALTSGGNGYTVNGSNVYYLDDCISNATENSGIMKSEDQLRKESTYEFWDFENVWLIDKEADYRFPMLRGVSDVAEIEVPSNCQHKNTSIQNNSDATCTEAGYTGDIVCLDCGLTMEVGMTIPAIGHAPKTYTTPSTCAENGFTITICTRCGETLSKEILPRLDHTWTSEVTQNPTCTAQGVKTYTCESCGETYTEPVDVLAHQWDDGKMTKAPSCTEAGEMTYTCATGGETRTEPIDKLEHEIVLVAGKAASCTEPGLTDGWQCKMCKKWFAEQQTIPALSHDPQIGKVVEPTCIDPGYTPFICTRCGETVSKTDPTDALGHDMQPTYVWAKDDSTVTATMACTRCDKTGATETAKVQNEVTVKPTCSTEGELTLTAAFNNKSFYGQTKTKTLPRDPDAHVFKVTVTPPTCIDEGYTSHMCTLCRYGYSDEIVPALGHKPVTDEAVPATCEAPGLTEGSHCSVCGEVLTAQEETPVLDHADADNDGQCDTCGNQMTGDGYCKYCGKVHTGAFGWLIQFFHNILAIFKR